MKVRQVKGREILDRFTESFLFCNEDASEWSDDDADTNVSDTPSFPSSTTISPTLEFQDSDDEVGNVARLLDSESDHVPDASYIKKYQDQSVIISGREVSVAWIMKVHAYHKFKPVTALLAVNYFDRFLSKHQLSPEKGLSFQLLAAACLTLAAKMEETHKLSLSDFQLFEPKFTFSFKMVRKMELMVMEDLNWRLHSITPLHYVEQFIARLASNSYSSPRTRESFCDNILSNSSSLILSTVYMIELVGLLPSAVAAAAVILSAGDQNVQVPESLFNGLNKDSVTSCHQAMKKNLSNAWQLSHLKSQLSDSTPPCSPGGILDAVNSQSLSSTQNSEASYAGASEPALKRLRPFIPEEDMHEE